MPSKLKPLWRCPKCGERFVTRNMWHSCGKYSLEARFAGCEPHVFSLFKKFEKMVRACGPVALIPQKTRIVFQARVRFAGCVPRKSHLDCALALPKRRNHPRFYKIESYSLHFHGHRFRVKSPDDLDAELQGWLREAYTVGEQKQLQPARSRRRR